MKEIIDDDTIMTTLVLPPSKSIYNRLLIMDALGTAVGQAPKLASKAVQDSSLPNDVTVLAKALLQIHQGKEPLIDVEDCGTAYRFLMSYLAVSTQRTVVLSGTDRLMDRPIEQLVLLLRQLGAKIEPIKIQNRKAWSIAPSRISSSLLDLRGMESSQFVTAILLIAPLLPRRIVLLYDSNETSSSYVNLTLQLMEEHGIRIEAEEDEIIIHPGRYLKKAYPIEADWASAIYWYAYVSLAPVGTSILLKGLNPQSAQADAKAKYYFLMLGISENWDTESNAVEIKKVKKPTLGIVDVDMRNIPDIAPTLCVTLALLKIPYTINGLETLPKKESNRLAALKENLGSMGIEVCTTADSIGFSPKKENATNKHLIRINTHQDHRIAMSFALASAAGYQIDVDNKAVVQKSYPDFWKHLNKIGAKII